MKPAQRRLLLGGLLVVTVILIVMAPPPEEEPIGAVERPARTEASRSRLAEAKQERATEFARKYRVDVSAVFAPTDWSSPNRVSAPPAPQPTEQQPAEPQVPPVPFRVLGRFVDNGVSGMFVQLNDRTLVARAGDFIGDLYRVESVSEQTMTVVYLPLNATQTVNAGAAP